MLRAQLKTSLTTTREFDVNEQWLSYDGQRMPCSSITGFAYGETFTDHRFMKTVTHHFKMQDGTGRLIDIAFNDVMNSNSTQLANLMADAMWSCFGNRILHEMITAISRGGEVVIGGMRLNTNGASFQYKPWFRKERTVSIPWENMLYEKAQHFDFVELKSSADRKASTILGLVGMINARVLTAMLDLKKRDPAMLDYLTGKKVYLQ